jgi:hypothetical protein
MTNAQQLVADFRALAATANTWKWAQRVTAGLTPLGRSSIGSRHGSHTYAIEVFRCADGSRFAYDLNGACQVWAMPADHQQEA